MLALGHQVSCKTAHLPAAAQNPTVKAEFHALCMQTACQARPPTAVLSLCCRRALLPMQVRATSCGGRPSAACTHALGRITLHAASSRRLAALRINACAASSQGGTPRKRGCAASRRQPAAPAEAEAAPASAAASGAAGRKERTSASLSALQAFVALHKRLPGRRDEIDGIRVGVWLNTQRIAYRRHLLQPELVAALEALPGWTWDPLKDEPVEEKFLSTLSSLKVSAGNSCTAAWQACWQWCLVGTSTSYLIHVFIVPQCKMSALVTQRLCHAVAAGCVRPHTMGPHVPLERQCYSMTTPRPLEPPVCQNPPAAAVPSMWSPLVLPHQRGDMGPLG